MPKNSSWTNYTKDLLRVADLSQQELAEKLEKNGVGSGNQGYIAGRLNSDETVPPDDSELEHWADAMSLSGEMRKKFFRLAQVERVPKRYRQEYSELWEKYEKTKKMLDNTQKSNKELRDMAESLQAQVAEITAQTAKLIAKQDNAAP
jgi:transcriptional regulator with XRE-family HTH domain